MKVKVRKVSASDLALAGLNLYLAARQLNYLPALNLARQACSEEERNFFTYIADMNLQREQRGHLLNELIKRAAIECDQAVLASLSDPKDYNHVFSPEFDAKMRQIIKNYCNPAVPAKLTPSPGGKECLGNGHWPGYECCCDECDHYLDCFPEYA